MNRVGTGAVAAACVVLLLAVTVALGVNNPVRGLGVGTDVLGPVGAESADEYVAEASRSLDDREDAVGDRWALVSFDRYVGAGAVASGAALGDTGIRVSTVFVRAPIDRVQTPVHAVGVPDTDEVIARAVRDAAALVVPGSDPRSAAVAEVVRGRYLDDCVCVAGVLVRADTATLRVVASSDGVRAVEALPPDAIFGRFAASPLLPEHTGATVSADDGDVPVR